MTAASGDPGVVVPGARFAVVGVGVTGRAVIGALDRRGFPVVALDDRADAAAAAADLGVEVVAAPGPDDLAAVLARVDVLLPSPGVPDRHPVFAAAAGAGVPVASEFDLAAAWDDRPWLAVTGTNGKTTVCELTAAMLDASGVATRTVGNTDTPLVAGIDDPEPEVFVVEASSFRLGHTRRFVPRVATWLNLAPDHLDAHRDLAAYEAAKARVWADPGIARAVANADDPTVLASRNPDVPTVTFSVRSDAADYRVSGGGLRGPEGALVGLDRLWRAHPHDVANSLAAAATALGGGATLDGVARALQEFTPGGHRLADVASAGGVRWVDDSKATSPHATLAALRSFDSVVLVAGGANKGLDLRELRAELGRIRAVVAIGDAAEEVADAFADDVPVRRAASMDEAVHHARALARQGDVVLLSPACASFDWYGGYHERGDAFVASVTALLAGGT